MSNESVLTLLTVMVAVLLVIALAAVVVAIYLAVKFGPRAMQSLRNRLGRGAAQRSTPTVIVNQTLPTTAPSSAGAKSVAPSSARAGEVISHGDVAADDPRITALGLEAPTSTAAVFRNLERIKPLLREQVAESDRLGRTSPLAGAALRATGVFLWCFPVSRGGLNASYADRLEAVSQIARIDVGMGWVLTWLSAHGEIAATLDDATFAEIYPTIDLPTVYSNTPLVKAIEVEGGGYRIEDGRWRLGSGGYHADRWMGGATVWDAEGNPVVDETTGRQKAIGLWLPADKIEQAHDWNSFGVRSSGSSSYFLTEPVEVPRNWAYDLELHGGRPYFFPFMGVAIGAAQHLVDLTLDSLRKRQRGGMAIGGHDKARMSEVLASLDMLVFGLRGYAQYIDAARAERESGIITEHESPWFESAGIPVHETLTKVRDITADVYGTGYVGAESEFGRVLRDIQVATAHFWFRTSDTPSSRSHRIDAMLADPEAVAVWDAGWPLEVSARG